MSMLEGGEGGGMLGSVGGRIRLRVVLDGVCFCRDGLDYIIYWG